MKLYSNTATPTPLAEPMAAFLIKARLSRHKDSMFCRDKTIHYLALYRKSLPAPGLCDSQPLSSSEVFAYLTVYFMSFPLGYKLHESRSLSCSYHPCILSSEAELWSANGCGPAHKRLLTFLFCLLGFWIHFQVVISAGYFSQAPSYSRSPACLHLGSGGCCPQPPHSRGHFLWEGPCCPTAGPASPPFA